MNRQITDNVLKVNKTPVILFEDDDILVVSKPADMIVNRADTTQHVETLQDWAEEYLGIDNHSVEESSDFLKRGGIVHRLDKETSGIVVIAKNEEAFKPLQTQFKEGKVEKTYITLTHGKVVPDVGEIKLPIGRLPWNRMRFGVFPAGRQSQTLYKVIQYLQLSREGGEEKLSLIEVYPKTGRTHQIRVHFQYLGHPVYGDELYAGRKISKNDRKLLPRHFLHATKISFIHPRTGETITYESPMPKELSNFLTRIS